MRLSLALATPCCDGRIDPVALVRLAERQVAHGSAVRLVVRAVDARVPVSAGGQAGRRRGRRPSNAPPRLALAR